MSKFQRFLKYLGIAILVLFILAASAWCWYFGDNIFQITF